MSKTLVLMRVKELFDNVEVFSYLWGSYSTKKLNSEKILR